MADKFGAGRRVDASACVFVNFSHCHLP
jgi:hypothetical protein